MGSQRSAGELIKPDYAQTDPATWKAVTMKTGYKYVNPAGELDPRITDEPNCIQLEVDKKRISLNKKKIKGIIFHLVCF